MCCQLSYIHWILYEEIYYLLLIYKTRFSLFTCQLVLCRNSCLVAPMEFWKKKHFIFPLTKKKNVLKREKAFSTKKKKKTKLLLHMWYFSTVKMKLFSLSILFFGQNQIEIEVVFVILILSFTTFYASSIPFILLLFLLLSLSRSLLSLSSFLFSSFSSAPLVTLSNAKCKPLLLR